MLACRWAVFVRSVSSPHMPPSNMLNQGGVALNVRPLINNPPRRPPADWWMWVKRQRPKLALEACREVVEQNWSCPAFWSLGEGNFVFPSWYFKDTFFICILTYAPGGSLRFTDHRKWNPWNSGTRAARGASIDLRWSRLVMERGG